MIAIMLSPFFIALQNFADAKERKLAEGQVLFQQGDKVEALFLVVGGEIRLIRYQADGSSITLQRTQAGSVLAEASLYSNHYLVMRWHSSSQQFMCYPKLQYCNTYKLIRNSPNTGAVI
ncbi:cyclic nucleotide-binding domain-containing protein [uncultured Thiothrix sp.]|uniref:cyclic nucleotide-binding domain-containing protein n=1 Tax=uncultured Thiothrix sp. TaxID=223185 RepID=UPI00260CE736|nr:cyclic nucleotide-binding domain-containing protein [uncultured Thiothrix sp.]HMT92822.1 cyclic nucleotide-binding domain-containing protein [Thiolinea sp.]